MKLAIINCLKANTVCTGAACLQAMNERTRSFSEYAGEEIELQAFMRCSGCGKTVANDPGMEEKLERILSLKPDVVHFGKCTKDREGEWCPVIADVKARLEAAGIRTVFGTH